VARLPHDAVTQLLEYTNSFLLADAGQTGHSDRQLQCLDLLDARFFCLDF
jgi:glutamine cyclotransferase